MSQEKLKTMVMQNFGGQTTCIMGDVKVANAREGIKHIMTRTVLLVSRTNRMSSAQCFGL